ncbi:S-layer homology domain-containing protein [Paenibacillus nasutitermitis]|uniref:SLH domain-containing protein n=1 Tax=Paenibacillus nasutitermitis TaxID=1652958 RepID=A0A916ZFC6_9BACL|nr:S-layer homology domain-containing protein [Paenibacillus nasutitermitis]GGD92409.1 hypothetical protein GCM10010911_58790 [Paenibacillus nasutitermitis]
MSKKISALLLMLSLVLQLLTPYGERQASAAAGSSNFLFPEESYDVAAPRTTSDERVTLKGTISGVNSSSITYSIYQLVNNQVAEKRENLTTNIIASGFNIEVFNLQLFPGLNKITFTGLQGGSQVTSSIYINYHNGPLFYNLEAALDGESFPISESGSTIVQSAPSRGRSSADISILGNAPNSSQVTVIVNGNSRTYQVNSTNNYSFIASPVNLKKGKNKVTLKVSNNNQEIESNRDIVFYNGDAVFYDVNLVNDDGDVQGSLESSSTILTDSNTVKITGKVIVPNKRYDEGDGTVKPHPDPTGTIKIDYSGAGSGSVDASIPIPQPPATDKFFEFPFTIPLNTLTYDTNYTVTLETVNEEKSTQLDRQKDSVSYTFKIKDNTKPYIYEINYLPGFTSALTQAQYDAIKSVSLDGKNLYNQPFAVEVLIGNSDAETLTVSEITNPAGNIAAPGTFTQSELTTTIGTVNKDINGVSTSFRRVLIKMTAPYEGTQTLKFHLSTSATGAVDGTAKMSMLVGPYVSYKNVYDNMKVEVDTTTANYMSALFNGSNANQFGLFAGAMENFKDPADIRFAAGGNVGEPQTIFFYINNTEIKLKGNGPASPAAPDGTFIVDGAPANTKKAIDALMPGENIIKFVYQGKKSSYTRTVKIYIIPTNLPVIPVEGSMGLFPYGVENVDPLPNDPDFPLSGSIYTTKKTEMKVFGTFDFIDLGGAVSNDGSSSITNSADAVQSKLSDLGLDKKNYILKIDSTNLPNSLEWNLNNELLVYDSDKPSVPAIALNKGAGVGEGAVPGITVSYDLKTQSFSFVLAKQKLNADGSSSVYNFFVYNSGYAGPRASYRLEVDPIALPYDLVRPLLPNKKIVNQNFIEVIINAPGADTVIINKVTAEKIKYDADNDGTIDYPTAYRAVVEGLKAGDNKITFTIENKSDKTSDSFVITYSPTNIPGAQYLQEMKNSHKIFDGALTLSFPKGTTLIRRDFNIPEQYKNQVFSNHKLLFAIANPEDGVVDRHDFVTLPQNFDRILQNFGYRFQSSYPTRFTKASPVYWVDAGMADDLETKEKYDPQTMGVDPYQFPNAKGDYGTVLPMYDERPDNRELIASKMGSLTLSYDPSMVEGIGTIITAYRYDAKNKYWDNIGGIVDTKKNTITVPFNQFGYYVVGKMVNSFMDITSHPYARNYMEAMYAKGIMNPVGADEFGANIYVSRAEFARMLVKALQIPLNYELSKPHFDDVSKTINPDALWDFRYVETAAREGLIRGTQPRTFDPTSNLTREEAAVILSRALETKLDTDADKIDKALQKQFKDYASISYYAKPAVSAIAKKGYIQGSPIDIKDPKKGYTFEPKSSLLRSDAAIIIGKVLVDLKRLPKLN